MTGMKRTLIALATALALAALAPLASVLPATAATWAPASTATIHPGVQTYTQGSQCTANFIYSDGTTVYIGQAAHCSSLGSSTDTNGCLAQSLPLGTKVDILGAAHQGTMVYNSWLAMQAAHETNADACAYNDLALIQIDPADVASVNPSVPNWGGPVAVNTTGTAVGDAVYSYGNSILRGGITLLSPKVGTSSGDDGNGWTHAVSTITPGVPGDSGSAFLDANGNALGDLSTLSVSLPGGVGNNVSDVSRELTYMHSHAGALAGVQLVPGTQSFDGTRVPLDTNQPVDDPVGGYEHFFGINR
jgi:hypothetical protein